MAGNPGGTGNNGGGGGVPAVGSGGAMMGSGGAMNGSGGSTSTGGAGGATAATCFPKCITDLTAGCPTSGECRTEMPLATLTTLCWSNGSTADVTTTSSLSSVTTVTNVHGASGPCYSLEVTTTIPATLTDYVWKRANGTAVADGTTKPSSPNVFDIICNGTPYTVDTSSAACQGKTVVPSCTTAGTCPF